MENSYEARYHQLEENHWWFRARRDIILRLLKNHPRGSNVLEVGCSGCLLLGDLKRAGFLNTFGLDISSKAIQLCQNRGFERVKTADAKNTGFPDDYFDVIISSDVLEHIKEEGQALKEWRRTLKNGGELILFVPAFQFLWSEHDVLNHHQRRYVKRQLAKALESAGFKIKRASYWNFILFFPAILSRFFSKNQLHQTNAVLDKTLFAILNLENRILEPGVDFPFGLSLFAIAQKINL